MKDFAARLEEEAEKKVEKIEAGDLNMIKKSFEASLVLADAFLQLKAFIADYTFRDEAEEIEFFKTVKPRICHRLIYYRKIYNIEMNRPVGNESQRSYLIDEIRGINRYNEKRSDFVRYYRSGLTHLDALYYLRGNLDTALYLESFHHERDPSFSTNCDFMAARLLANERLIRYLTKELEAFELRQAEESLLKVRLTWKATKTELTELLFALDSRKAFGKLAFITKATSQLMRDLGAIQSPQNAFLLNLGLETLHLRVPQHCKNALAVAQWLQKCDKVAWVHYPELEGNPYHELAKKYLPNGSCGVLSFGLKGGREVAIKFMDSLKLAAIVTHVADARTCVLHPASHTHRQLSDEQLIEAGVAPDLIRFSVGIESADDIIADIEQALNK